MLELQTIQHSNYQTFKLSIQTIKQKHVRASNYSTFKLSIQTIKQKQSNIQTTHKSLYSAAAFKKSKITSGLTVLKRLGWLPGGWMSKAVLIIAVHHVIHHIRRGIYLVPFRGTYGVI